MRPHGRRVPVHFAVFRGASAIPLGSPVARRQADSRCPCHGPRERGSCRQRPSVQINRRDAPSEFRQPVTDARYPGVGDITHIFTQMLMSTPHIGRILAGVEVAPTDAQDMLPSSPSVRDRLQSNASHAHPFGNS